jgi:DNA helicase-2/ATP-dependent DNA helicase PcrA
MKLTNSQREAIEHDGGNLQLIACAGSGKTEVVAQRVAHHLKKGWDSGLRPSGFVAFTFTDKAAAELKDRIWDRVRERLGDVPGMAEMYVGTIHAFCLELLKEHMPEYLKYEVLSEVQRALLVDRNSKQSGLTTSSTLTGTALRRFTDTDVYCRSLDVLREDDCDAPQLAGCSVFQGLALYRAVLRAKRYLDYSGILEIAAGVLESNQAVRDRLRGRIKHLIVDEYQDVNPVQERLVRALSGLGAVVCVVGDDDQTIYQWRGSDISNIVTFTTRYPGVRTIALQENFRSSKGIVETARDFIKLNGHRLAKAMEPVDAQPFETGDICAHGFADPAAEAEFVAQTVKAMRGIAFKEGDAERGLSYSDCAILLRSVKGNAGPIMQALSAADIPFVVVGMSDLFGTREAEAARVSFYFIASAANVDAAAVRAAWTAASLGISAAALSDAIEFLTQTRRSLDEADNSRWSLYSLQRTFLALLETLGVREGSVPGDRGEVVFYNLGKFSQAISDFEQIHFHSAPRQKYESFAGFLEHQADGYYAEGWQDNQYASPDAVRIMTVHQAKGMQWPVVFLPALVRNRFPAAGVGGRTVWHLIPQGSVPKAARYLGDIEDERRLFYVAMTRSQKFLFATWAPVAGNRRFTKASEFYDAILASRWVKRPRVSFDGRRRSEPQARASVSNVVLTFSDLKYFFECPYQFKLRVLYGFNAPLHEALGYGKSLHDTLAEVHARAIRGDIPKPTEAASLVATHLHTPFAYPSLRATLETAATQIVAEYLSKRRDDLSRLEYSEKAISLDLGDGVSVKGRIDLVRRLDTSEVSIVDMKTTDRAQAESVTEQQLHIYALGYEQLTGKRADFVEIYELDTQNRKPRAVDDDFINQVRTDIKGAARSLQLGQLPPKPTAVKCGGCDYRRICSHAACP